MSRYIKKERLFQGMKVFHDWVEWNPVPLYTNVKKTQQRLYFNAIHWSNPAKVHISPIHQSSYCTCFVFTVDTELCTEDKVLGTCKKCKDMILAHFIFFKTLIVAFTGLGTKVWRGRGGNIVLITYGLGSISGNIDLNGLVYGKKRNNFAGGASEEIHSI